MTPLTEDCGILEWVPKTGTLRTAVQGMYQQEGLFDPRKTNGTIDSMYKHHEHKYQVWAVPSQIRGCSDPAMCTLRSVRC